MPASDLILNLGALGTHWRISVHEPLSPLQRRSLSQRLRFQMGTFVDRYTRFRSDSLIGRLNCGETLTDIPTELFDILSYAEWLRELSGGHYNAAVGSLLEGLGYDAAYSFADHGHAPVASGSPFTSLSKDSISLAPNRHLDLGGIGRGWLTDSLAATLRGGGVSRFSIVAGNDAYALGGPLTVSTDFGDITVRGQALATSRPQTRQWTDMETGISRHHLVDPLSGESASDRIAALAIADTGLAADAASTLLFLVPDQMVVPVASALGAEYLIASPGTPPLRSNGFPVK